MGAQSSGNVMWESAIDCGGHGDFYLNFEAAPKEYHFSDVLKMPLILEWVSDMISGRDMFHLSTTIDPDPHYHRHYLQSPLCRRLFSFKHFVVACILEISIFGMIN